MKIYKIVNKKMPWGDYGNILLTGLVTEERELIMVRRTGPYIPPIIISGINTILVTEKFKNLILHSGLSGFDFRSVRVEKIVNLDWTNWDLKSAEPKFYPESGEPEDYIEEGNNDEYLLNKAEKVWKMNVTNSIDVELKQGSEWWIKIPKVKVSSWNGNFGVTDKILYTFVDEKSKDWLVNTCDGNLNFEEVDVE